MVINGSNIVSSIDTPKKMTTDDIAFIKNVTCDISADEAKYVADVKSVCDTCDTCGCTEDECADILFITKIMSFADKFRILHWAAKDHTEHIILDGFLKDLEIYKDAIAEVIQGLHGQFSAQHELFQYIHLPLGDNSLVVIDELKNVINDWFTSKADLIEYEGARNATSTFLELIYKTIYLLRLQR